MAIEYIKKAAKTSATGEDNTREVGAACARISRSEGMEGHACAGDTRLTNISPMKLSPWTNYARPAYFGSRIE